MKNRPNRKSPRLQGYDYSKDGAYFITMVCHKRRCLFGEIIEGKIELSEIGKIVEEEWVFTGELRPELLLDEYYIMPNHFHAIVWIRKFDELTFSDVTEVFKNQVRKKTVFGEKLAILSNIVSQFKSSVTRRSKELGHFEPLWQKRFHDRIIRNHDEYERIKYYIEQNPVNWTK